MPTCLLWDPINSWPDADMHVLSLQLQTAPSAGLLADEGTLDLDAGVVIVTVCLVCFIT